MGLERQKIFHYLLVFLADRFIVNVLNKRVSDPDAGEEIGKKLSK